MPRWDCVNDEASWGVGRERAVVTVRSGWESATGQTGLGERTSDAAAQTCVDKLVGEWVGQ